MKRNKSNNHRPLLQVLGTAVLAAALVAGPGLAGVAYAVEPSPTPRPSTSTPTQVPTSPVSSPAPESTTTGSTPPAAPAPAATSTPSAMPASDTASASKNESMADAVGIGGAEMGQRSARVAASSSSSSFKKLSTESLGSEGSWMPTFGVQGLDVSGHQPSIDWQQQWNMGARFAYVKASEGNYYTNPSYSSQYQGSRNVGMIRGAYHFAIPNWSSGADQARYFVQNGGGWTADGYTMPPVLDFEFNPYEGRTINGFYFGNTCYGMSSEQLGSWVRDFGNTVLSMTGRLPVIYTNTNWWNQCLGNPAGFGEYPLWVAAYPGSPTNNAGPVPSASWSTYSIWQYSSTGPFAGDSNVWNGDYSGLQSFARYADGTRFAIGPNSSTIYAVSGNTKYPVPNWEIYQRFARVSPLGQVSQAFLDQMPTGPAVGRFARDSGGSIYLIDAGRRLHVPSCAMMNDFGGGNCQHWVPLSSRQIAMFSDGGTLANATSSPSGKFSQVSAMTKREFFDPASLSAAGFPSHVASVSDELVASMPYAAAAPIVRSDVIVVDRASRQPYIYTAGKLLAVPASIISENVWASSIKAAALDTQSIAKLPQGPSFAGFASNDAATARYVIGSTSKFLMADTAQWPETTVQFSNALLAAIPTGPTISNPAFVKSSSSPVVYRWDKSMAREVPDISTLAQLGLGKFPVIYSLSATTISFLPKGPAVLPLARLVVGDKSPMVYLIDGADKMLELEDFRITNSLGIGGYTRVAQSALAPYTSIGTLQPVIRCVADTHLGYGGGTWTLPGTTATAQLPARNLQESTCSAMPVQRGNMASTVFVKALDSPMVYLMVDGTKRPVMSWTRLVELNNGSGSPVIAEFTRSALDPVPTGSPA